MLCSKHLFLHLPQNIKHVGVCSIRKRSENYSNVTRRQSSFTKLLPSSRVVGLEYVSSHNFDDRTWLESRWQTRTRLGLDYHNLDFPSDSTQVMCTRTRTRHKWLDHNSACLSSVCLFVFVGLLFFLGGGCLYVVYIVCLFACVFTACYVVVCLLCVGVWFW